MYLQMLSNLQLIYVPCLSKQSFFLEWKASHFYCYCFAKIHRRECVNVVRDMMLKEQRVKKRTPLPTPAPHWGGTAHDKRDQRIRAGGSYGGNWIQLLETVSLSKLRRLLVKNVFTNHRVIKTEISLPKNYLTYLWNKNERINPSLVFSKQCMLLWYGNDFFLLQCML